MYANLRRHAQHLASFVVVERPGKAKIRPTGPVALSAWELDCHGTSASAVQVSRHLWSSVAVGSWTVRRRKSCAGEQLNVHRNDHQHDHHKRTGRKYENYAGDAHEDVVPACLSSPFLQREPGPGRTITGGRIVQACPGHASVRAIEIDHRASRHLLQQAYCYAECRNRR
jgi:hypothetical protein